MKNLEKIIKDAKSSNKYKEGVKEVRSNVKGSKLIIVSNSLGYTDKQFLEKTCKELKVPLYFYTDNSIKLGRLFNRPYRISAVALKSVADEDVSALLDTH
ncbi:MAG TPA: ribosomal L7Ae/L30e/S12e/Gadd45 family protein [Nitrososphaeraceae archaeon]|jgi:ribosomal protein L30E|nr:ribosomal L7Ae/L30e/S12e/Gadd45 family protein [Nitrososphaeraceae archaeon]